MKNISEEARDMKQLIGILNLKQVMQRKNINIRKIVLIPMIKKTGYSQTIRTILRNENLKRENTKNETQIKV